MRVDVFEVAQMLVAHAVEVAGDEISIIAYYGSYATGEAAADSDLDLFYIPVEGSRPDIARSFVIDGILFDFWPITWEQVGRLAEGRFRSFSVAPRILANAKVLYAHTEADRDRLERLRQAIAELKEPAAEVGLVRRALRAYPNAVYQLENLRLACGDGDRAGVRDCGWRVAEIVIECLALVNQVIFDRSFARDLSSLDRLAASPDELKSLIRTITTSREPGAVLAAAERLVADTRAVLRERQESLSAGESVASVFRGTYAEIHEQLKTLRSACERGDAVRASAESRAIQNDISRMLGATRTAVGYGDFNRLDEFREAYRELGFPDLMAAYDPEDLDRLADLADELDTRIRAWLEEQGIAVNVFQNTGELARWLASAR